MTKKNDYLCTRGIVADVKVRDYDDDTSTVTFVAATENGVDTYEGREYLNMEGIDLNRYAKNPVVLDSHNRDRAAAVIGKATTEMEGRDFVAHITFAPTEEGQKVYTLVRGDFIRTLSVGFLPRKKHDVGDGEERILGDRTISGPARIIDEWELYEISVVPVPADAEAIKRSLKDSYFLLDAKEHKMADDIVEDVVEDEAVADEVTPDEEVKEEEVKEEEDTEDEAADDGEAIMALGRSIGLESDAKYAVVAGLSLDEARAQFKAKLDEVDNAVNTVEPVAVTEKEETKPLEKRDFTG